MKVLIMKKQLLLMCVVATTFAGCATTLKPGAEKVKISENSAPTLCTKIDPPYTYDLYDLGGTTEDQKANIREIYFKNAALDKGGNYVKLEKLSANRSVGTIFRCPPSE
jgi:hypothetical protein